MSGCCMQLLSVAPIPPYRTRDISGEKINATMPEKLNTSRNGILLMLSTRYYEYFHFRILSLVQCSCRHSICFTIVISYNTLMRNLFFFSCQYHSEKRTYFQRILCECNINKFSYLFFSSLLIYGTYVFRQHKNKQVNNETTLHIFIFGGPNKSL